MDTSTVEDLAYVIAALVAELDREHPWRRDALCREHADLFAAATDLSAARAVCAECSVTRECEAFALEEQPEHGIWAGELHQPEDSRPAFTCAHCGSTFRRVTRPSRPTPKYCSSRCSGLANSTTVQRCPNVNRRAPSTQSGAVAKPLPGPPCGTCGKPTAPGARITEFRHPICAACDVAPEPTDCPICTRDRKRWGGRVTCRECRTLAKAG
jgi:hypothetical protein